MHVECAGRIPIGFVQEQKEGKPVCQSGKNSSETSD